MRLETDPGHFFPGFKGPHDPRMVVADIHGSSKMCYMHLVKKEELYANIPDVIRIADVWAFNYSQAHYWYTKNKEFITLISDAINELDDLKYYAKTRPLSDDEQYRLGILNESMRAYITRLEMTKHDPICVDPVKRAVKYRKRKEGPDFITFEGSGSIGFK